MNGVSISCWKVDVAEVTIVDGGGEEVGNGEYGRTIEDSLMNVSGHGNESASVIHDTAEAVLLVAAAAAAAVAFIVIAWNEI